MSIIFHSEGFVSPVLEHLNCIKDLGIINFASELKFNLHDEKVNRPKAISLFNLGPYRNFIRWLAGSSGYIDGKTDGGGGRNHSERGA